MYEKLIEQLENRRALYHAQAEKCRVAVEAIRQLEDETVEQPPIIVKREPVIPRFHVGGQMKTGEVKGMARFIKKIVEDSALIEDGPMPPRTIQKTESKKHPGGRPNKSSRYKGVARSSMPRKDGSYSWQTNVWKDGRMSHYGNFKIEEEAAAKVQDVLGNKAEAERLYAIARRIKADQTEQNENNPDRIKEKGYNRKPKLETIEPDPNPETIPRWECVKCCNIYKTLKQPASCDKCGSLVFNDL